MGTGPRNSLTRGFSWSFLWLLVEERCQAGLINWEPRKGGGCKCLVKARERGLVGEGAREECTTGGSVLGLCFSTF